ncbi:MAG: TetR/AcrR family transcriptional regulator [Nocardioidaceae bacterium]
MTTPRRRRTPEQAREEILTAATDLIARYGPDGVGLRQVADAIGVTHGLVTHYFGTYQALVRAVLQRENERHREQVRERLRADQGVPYADGMTRVLFETLADERYIRLWAWSQLHAEGVGTSSQGLSELVDAMQAGIRAAVPEAETPDRARVEAVVLLALSAAYGYALGKPTWLAALGYDPGDPTHDATFRAALSSALGAHLAGGTAAC